MSQPEQKTDKQQPLVVLTYPNPVLSKKSSPVEKIDQAIIDLGEKMIQTMLLTDDGVGLAAPQVGYSLRMTVINPECDPLGFTGLDDIKSPFVLINPEIIEREGSYVEEEGCLSLPGLYYDVERPERVKVRFTGTDGQVREFTATDYMAKLVCHEIDHLDGALFWDRVSRFKRDWLKLKFRRLVKNR